jgi:FkbH-like protein
MDLYARQPIAGGAALISFAAALRRTLRALRRTPSKVLALDLDNTLWGGVLGEDGVSGLKIGSEYPGNVYLRIQQLALGLKRQGVLLVLLSKNNWTDVEQAFDSLPGMALRLSDFATLRVNWRPKHENLKEVAEELNLGLDSFVFVDDQGFEREEMAYFLPEVKILPVADDPLIIWRTLAGTDLFDAFQLSREDRARNADYGKQKERKTLAEKSESVEDFLQSLNLQASIEPVNENSLGRVVQMLGKTNQFNVTTRRHSELEVRRMLGAQGSILLTLSLRDRFGDQGIVGLLMAETEEAAGKAGSIKIDSFLLSCRAIGRGAELALWAEFLTQASAAGYKEVVAEYVATKKNSQVADLFDRLGMRLIEGDAQRRFYRLELPAQAEMPAWINLVETVNYG